MGRKKAALSGQLADTDLKLLRIFKTVVDCGGVTPAEHQLNLANSTISNYVADLEKRLDMHLCDRGRGGFSLTPQGNEVYQAIDDLLSAVERFRSRVNRSHQQIVGNLHLGFAEHLLALGSSDISSVIAQFSKLAPEVRIQVSTLESDSVMNAVLNKEIDLGITVASRRHDELICTPLFDEQMLLYCAKGHPLFEQDASAIQPDDLRQYRFVESPRLMPGREIHSDMRHWNMAAKAHHQEGRTTLILSGQYLGMLPSHLVTSWGLASQLRAVLPERYGYKNTYSSMTRRRHSNGLIVELFQNCLARIATTDHRST